MEKKDVLSKILAALGTVLVWLPIVFMLVTGLTGSLQSGQFLMDFLIPAEIFPVELLGALLLLWAALRTKLRRGWVIWGLVATVVLIVGTQALAMVTGLATNPDHPGGWPLYLVFAGMIGFDLALAAIGVGGILLLIDLFRGRK